MTLSLKNTLRLALLALATAALGLVIFLFFRPDAVNQSLANDFGRGDYQLTTTTGESFNQAALKGAPTAVFFGFTHCPEVCPTTLGDIATWQEELGPKADQLRIRFVTVDPERDTHELLKDYVGWLPNTQGVTGPREEIDKAIRAFKIYARAVPLSDDEYTMDHSAYVLLFDKNGRFFEPIGYQEDFERAIAKLNRLLG